jgi:ADP-ribosyl-[dinitrogen reductase] hydrolase
MAQCIADSLLAKGDFDPIDLRTRFSCWWALGYCNAFGFSSKVRGSVGLGGNISQSFSEFNRDPTIPYTKAGDVNTSGNGSVMRNSPIPVRYYKQGVDVAMQAAYNQSKTTHQGHEAAELCRLLTFVCHKGIETGNKDRVFEAIEKEFNSPLYTVTCLAKSQEEERHEENKHLKLKERNWNWKDDNFKFCEARAIQNPGYIGSYAMDAVSMALHCVYTTDNFVDAVVKCVNLRGDSDSHGAVCAQIAGAIYGASAIPKDWIRTVQQWDRNGDIALKAYKLFHNQKL